jgi:arsenate reductase
VVVGAALGALIVTFGSVSGAHFNPAVTLVDALFGGLSTRLAMAYVAVQLAGGAAGVVLANIMFDLPAVAMSTTQRSGLALLLSEAVATAGLVVVIFGVGRSRHPGAVPAAVGAWIAAAIYATSSTSFANPAVTVGRVLTDTYTGIAPLGVGPFVVAQAVGALAAAALVGWLFRPDPAMAAGVVVAAEPPADDTD